MIRRGDWHDLLEFSVSIQLEGDFAASYLLGDNRNVIATDSMKNTVYVLAKENTFDSPETFALLLSRHFPATYPQVRSASVSMEQMRWDRIRFDGKPHPHAFTSGGGERRTAGATVTAKEPGPNLTGGIAGLQVLKTTHSEFTGFVADRYRTQKDASDRIFATAIDAEWKYTAGAADFNACFDAARSEMLRVFAAHHSLAVQQTLLAMGEAILSACPTIESVELKMPNQHRIPFNLQPFGLENNNEIFVPTDEPYGLITGAVTRK